MAREEEASASDREFEARYLQTQTQTHALSSQLQTPLVRAVINAEWRRYGEEEDNNKNGGNNKDVGSREGLKLVYPPRLATHEQVVAHETLFLETLAKFHDAVGTPLRMPQVGGKNVNLHSLYCDVTAHGGIRQVIRGKKWKDIVGVFTFPTRISYPSYFLRKLYTSLLHGYEQVYFFGAEGQFVALPDILPTPSPAASSRAYDVFTYPASEDSEPLNDRKRRKKLDSVPVTADPARSIGNVVTGAIEGKFEHGYFVTMMVGAEKLKGVLYHVPSTIKAHQFASVPELFHQMSSASKVSTHELSLRGIHRRRQQRKKREIHRKDPNAPRPFKTGYNFFYVEQRERLKAYYEHREKELTRVIGGLWNRLTAEERMPYLENSQKDKERYTREAFEYKERNKLLVNPKEDDLKSSEDDVHDHSKSEGRITQTCDADYSIVSNCAPMRSDGDVNGSDFPQVVLLNGQFGVDSAALETKNYEQETTTRSEKVELLRILNTNNFDTPHEAIAEQTSTERRMEEGSELKVGTSDFASVDTCLSATGFSLPQELLKNQFPGGAPVQELVNYGQECATYGQKESVHAAKFPNNLDECSVDVCEAVENEQKVPQQPDLNYAYIACPDSLKGNIHIEEFHPGREQSANNQLSGGSDLVICHNERHEDEAYMLDSNEDFQEMQLLANHHSLEANSNVSRGQAKAEREMSTQCSDLFQRNTSYSISHFPQEEPLSNQLSLHPMAQKLINCNQDDVAGSRQNSSQKLEFLLKGEDSNLGASKGASCELTESTRKASQQPDLNHVSAPHCVLLEEGIDDTDGLHPRKDQLLKIQLSGHSALQELVNDIDGLTNDFQNDEKSEQMADCPGESAHRHAIDSQISGHDMLEENLGNKHEAVSNIGEFKHSDNVLLKGCLIKSIGALACESPCNLTPVQGDVRKNQISNDSAKHEAMSYDDVVDAGDDTLHGQQPRDFGFSNTANSLQGCDHFISAEQMDDKVLTVCDVPRGAEISVGVDAEKYEQIVGQEFYGDGDRAHASMNGSQL